MAYYETYMPNENGELQRVVINAGIGFCLPYYGETAPPGTLACDGSEISREAYKELFQVLGTKAGAGDGSTTFNLPDFRGCFIRGTGGNAAELGMEQTDAIRDITGQFAATSLGTLAIDNTHGAFTCEQPVLTQSSAAGNTIGTGLYWFNASDVVPTAGENRPVNVALLWCIIYV